LALLKLRSRYLLTDNTSTVSVNSGKIREQYVELKFCCAYSSTMQEHWINKTVQLWMWRVSLLEFT